MTRHISDAATLAGLPICSPRNGFDSLELTVPGCMAIKAVLDFVRANSIDAVLMIMLSAALDAL